VQLRPYVQECGRWLKQLLQEKPRAATTARCCFSITGNEITFLYLNKLLNSIELFAYDTFQFETLNSLSLILAGLSKKYNLANVPAYLLLDPEHYQLFLIESLPVKADEFKEALNWRLKSLLTYPMKEATIDYFTLPISKSAPDTQMIAAVAAKTKLIESYADALEKAQLHLTVIDIPELALRNLTGLYEQDEKSTAIIYFNEKIAILNITRSQSLYFTRKINLYHEDEATKKSHEELGLDIMRSFDYFQIQWRYPSPSRIFVAAKHSDSKSTAEALAASMLQPVEPFTLQAVQLSEEKLKLLEEKYLLAFGCALRETDEFTSTS